MCGIVGVVGNVNAKDVLLGGLKKLEYRGYDSAGIYVNDKTGTPTLIKRVGRISKLEAAIPAALSGTQGIGHTRWATSGAPSIENAHPHVSADGRFYMVHNGVLTNAAQLRDKYLQDVTLVSDTDTEIAVQLLAKFVAAGNDVMTALHKLTAMVEGSYAFAIADRDDASRIYAAKSKSPLLIAKGKGFNALASDALALLDRTHEFVELNDGELVELTADTIHIENAAGATQNRDSYTLDIDATATDKGAYPYYMLKEIDEQPAVLRRLLTAYVKPDGHVDMPANLLNALAAADRLYFVAAGTSYHASLAAAPMFEELAHVPVSVHLASEFGYHMPLLSERPMFIFLTQSGETADIRQVLVKVKAQHLPTLTITNVPTSTLAREADYALSLHAGPEIAVASTKAYTAQVATCSLLAKALGEYKGVAAAEQLDLFHELSMIADAQQSQVDEKEVIHTIVKDALATTRNAFYIGRGSDYYVALEAALKLKEISYVQAEGFAAGELKHGTIALIEKDTPVIAIITDPVTAAHTRANASETAARGAKVITLAAKGLAAPGDDLELADVHPLLSPLAAIIPCQLLAYYTSMDRGYDVDRPRNLAKSVTVE
ncbi:glutamine--fructose-6-phosphate transaminase (isomerizing) [Lacticaseibacillus pabuli]|uniref:Glutamine--fructose-6-phosphate aminotransferase [isomerizing] n=1 Tax=Lacticaseibacillus pabuli TaxID=3025672 RepID=A0ABY7WNW3_9LACO|nr:glutamine--fructose-6-phosphate transaminase (isomerizing) [Lacticaseibacillus sp. KACC 23028]WDF81882.1 glutamine--fructose-6-phosphate transaminase (isomerizing) [Lacticaseibacillus sp. KACC 23028]